jgi:chromate transporter
LSDDSFLAGYGVAQAPPGPLFTFSAYLGAAVAPAGAALLWSAVALIFIFLPGVLIALAGLPVWLWLGHHPAARAALAGINASVVGVLGAALYNPIWLSAVANGRDVAIALVGFLLLERWRVPPLAIVVFCVGGIDIGIGQLSASCGRLMRLWLMQTNAGKVPERFTGRDI